jgi:hypothetical protein
MQGACADSVRLVGQECQRGRGLLHPPTVGRRRLHILLVAEYDIPRMHLQTLE